ncbi:hypothetical protein [Halobacteriovorax sp. HLS]|uniref:hypothetical protein n=1 Tax=Halobacteriovorax sp. HLS TaxID=2234000 RepID=UPI000FD7D1E1|nr:hypothetical protein [Halobacteriovorax sp. HLS]
MQRIFAILICFTIIVSYYIYNIRSSNFLPVIGKTVSNIKKQQWGTCWSFSAISTLESSILTSGLQHTTDLSEYHLDKYNGFNRDGFSTDPKKDWYSTQGKGFQGSNTDALNSGLMVHLGGDFTVAAAYLSNTKGAVEEYKTPSILTHKDFDKFGNTPTTGVLLENNYEYIYPQRIEWLTTTGTDSEKRDVIKEYIRKFGSVSSAQYMTDTPIGFHKNKEVHLNLTTTKPNHAINIVGWDDDFNYRGHIGAWIIKDSDHIDDKTGEKISFYYIPYDDLITAKDPKMGGVSFNSPKKREGLVTIRTHALHGWRFNIDSYESIKNHFRTSNDKEELIGIGVYIPTVNTKSKIAIKVNGKTIGLKKELVAKFPGFYYIDVDAYTIDPNSQIEVTQSNDSKVYALDSSSKMDVLLSSNKFEISPQTIESKALKNQSFLLRNGKWIDLQDMEQDPNINYKRANFPINLYTKKRLLQ